MLRLSFSAPGVVVDINNERDDDDASCPESLALIFFLLYIPARCILQSPPTLFSELPYALLNMQGGEACQATGSYLRR